MLRPLLFSLFTVSLSTAAHADKMPDRATFLCEDGNGVSYGVDLGKTKKTLTIQPKDGGVKSFPLSDPNAGLFGGGSSKAMVYDRWKKDGKDLFGRLDPTTELVTRYVGNTIELELYLDHRRPAGLRCRSG